MKFVKTLALAAISAVGFVSLVHAADIKPAVIYDMGGKFDKSFNEGVYNGVKKFTDETGIEVMEFEVTNETQREQAMRRMAERGATIILGVGFAQADAIAKVAAEYPDKQFSIIDVSWLDAPNLRQYTFKEHEGSYLVGYRGCAGQQVRKTWFCWRDGYSTYTQICLWLCRRGKSGKWLGRYLSEYDRYNPFCLE